MGTHLLLVAVSRAPGRGNKKGQGAHDKNLHDFGRAALLRRPRVQGRAAALPYHESEDFCPAPKVRHPAKMILPAVWRWGILLQ